MGHLLLSVKKKITDFTKAERTCPNTINLCRTGQDCSNNLETIFSCIIYNRLLINAFENEIECKDNKLTDKKLLAILADLI